MLLVEVLAGLKDATLLHPDRIEHLQSTAEETFVTQNKHRLYSCCSGNRRVLARCVMTSLKDAGCCEA